MSSPPLPRLRLVLAVSLDGRLAPPEGGAAQIGGRGDRRVLEEALAWADAALLGAETLRRHGSTCLIHAPDLLSQRRCQGRAAQPVALVASRSGRLPAALPFFRQPLQRWLLLAQGASRPAAPAALEASVSLGGRRDASDVAVGGGERGPIAGVERPTAVAAAMPSACIAGQAEANQAGFARVLPMARWQDALRELAQAGLERVVVLGGAALAASLLAEDLLEELQLTLCPQLLGGEHSWLGPGAALPLAARGGWRLLEHRHLEGEELLLRYGRAQARA